MTFKELISKIWDYTIAIAILLVIAAAVLFFVAGSIGLLWIGVKSLFGIL